MKGGVTSDVIAEVRSRASIQEVISEHIVLKRAGKEYKGCARFITKSPLLFMSILKRHFQMFWLQ